MFGEGLFLFQRDNAMHRFKFAKKKKKSLCVLHRALKYPTQKLLR